MGGKAKEADGSTFVACDEGIIFYGNGVVLPHGYGKDKARVFYCNAGGKASWVRKANPQTFLTGVDDSRFGKDELTAFFGKDESNVFFIGYSLPKARVEYWTRISGYYSKDDCRVFYQNRHIPFADPATFEAVPKKGVGFLLARDKCNYYRNDRAVEKDVFLKDAACPACFQNPPDRSDPHWFTATVVALANAIYEERAFDRMPILADALEEAGCTNQELLGHCRGAAPGIRGCWVMNLIPREELKTHP